MKDKELYNIEHFEEIDSTNGYALRSLQSLTDRQVIVSDVQTCGKGRMNRTWVSDKKGNVYMSIVLKPCDKVNNQLSLTIIRETTQYMSVIVCKTLESYSVETEIKWPNDVLISGKKIAGILSQSSVRGDNFKGLVLGVGVNLNLSQEDVDKIDQPATALNLQTGVPVDRDSFIESLLDRFFEDYETFLSTGFSLIMEDYINRSKFLGKRITIKTHDSTESVTALKIRKDGALVALGGDLREKVITAGELGIGFNLP
jgi:BirA family biotin operon repressor/biotin-[acetyl-CoA-carboxylase] ligase